MRAFAGAPAPGARAAGRETVEIAMNGFPASLPSAHCTLAGEGKEFFPGAHWGLSEVQPLSFSGLEPTPKNSGLTS